MIRSSLKVFTIVNLKICIENDEDPLVLSGRITWVREIEDKKNELERTEQEIEEKPGVYIIGIQFLTLYARKKEKLQSLLKNYDSR